jgi:1,4-dihydroxy-2-naphthoate octaprenyltransferase
MEKLRSILNLGKPLFLLLAAMTYVFGSVLADYLGFPWDVGAFWVGLGWVVFVSLGMNLLAEMFRSFEEPLIPGETPSERLFTRNRILWVALVSLVAAGILTYYLQRADVLSPIGLFVLGCGILLATAYAVPPIRLMTTGFGELTLAVFLAFIVPSIGFLLQAKYYHHILTLLVFPLTLLGFLFFVVMSFPTYADDLKYGRTTLLIRIGWEQTVFLHNSLMIGVYILFLAAIFFGVPLRILWPVFLALPFAVLQAIWLQNIARGAAPIWKFLVANAIALFSLTIYLSIITFWIH